MERNEKQDKLVIRIVVILIIAIVFYKAINYLYMNRHVKFKDENMAKTICANLGSNVEPEDVCYGDLKKIKSLNIGYLSNYDTLEDISACTNVEELMVNGMGVSHRAIKNVNGGKPGKALSKNQIERVENEMSKIIPRYKKLKTFLFTDCTNTCDIQKLGIFS